MTIVLILLGFAVLSAFLLLWQWHGAGRFPLNERLPVLPVEPGVTFLKPLKGADAETAACLESWLTLRGRGPVQVLFGVAAMDDPVVPIVRALLEKHPAVDAELVLCGEVLGANSKVSKLVQLARRAKHDVLIVSDADVFVPSDLTSQIAAKMADPLVGLVNCFYRLANPTTTAMRWEAVAINADFWSQVLQSTALKPMDFALGAVMAVRRDALVQSGGFEPLVNHLADDCQLGHRVAGKGFRIELSPVVVECREHVQGWRQVWAHQLRWARTIRVCQPAPFFASILSNATLWPLLAWVASFRTSLSVAGLVLPLILLRVVAAAAMHRRFSPQTFRWTDQWLVPIKDLLNAAIWLSAFVGNRVIWRGVAYRVKKGGELETGKPDPRKNRRE